MKIHHPELTHATSLDEAVALQKTVQSLVSVVPLEKQPHRVTACDVAYSDSGDWGTAAAVTVNLETLSPIEQQTAHVPATFPYVPGLFAFRELPILLEALRHLTQTPDVILVEGQGIAHPQQAGLASHLGVVLGVPTFGCAKSPLSDDWSQPEDKKGAWTEIQMNGTVAGAAYRSRVGSSPLFISPGHLMDLRSALDLMPGLSRDHRLPEPLLTAHNMAVKARDRRTRPPQTT